MRPRPLLVLTVWLVAAGSGACLGAGRYRCTDDGECRWGQRRGTCEATGYCSYPDPECESGARYSDLAGALAGACVEGESGTTTTTSTTTTTTTTTPTTTTTTTSTSTGDVEPLPGTPVWDPPERVHTAGPEKDAVFWDVAVRPDDTIVLVGMEVVADEDALRVSFDGDGDLLWAHAYDSGLGDDLAKSVSAGVGSEIYVAGLKPNPTEIEGWIAVVEPLDGDIELEVATAQFPTVDLDYMHPATVVVAGRAHDDIGARAFTDMLVPQWIAQEPIVAGDGLSTLVVDGVADVAYAAGRMGGAAAIVTFVPGDPDPMRTIWTSAREGSGVQGLAWSGSDLVVVGFVGLGMRDAWVQRVAPDGTPGASWTSEMAGEEEIEAVAVDGDGSIVAAGFVTALAQDARVWKLSPDGALVWEWTWAEPIAADDVARAIAVWPGGDVVVAGGRTADDGSTDAWVVRLTP